MKIYFGRVLHGTVLILLLFLFTIPCPHPTRKGKGNNCLTPRQLYPGAPCWLQALRVVGAATSPLLPLSPEPSANPAYYQLREKATVGRCPSSWSCSKFLRGVKLKYRRRKVKRKAGLLHTDSLTSGSSSCYKRGLCLSKGGEGERGGVAFL